MDHGGGGYCFLLTVEFIILFLHSLVTPGPGPLHLAPGVTYTDQALHLAPVVNLHPTQTQVN